MSTRIAFFGSCLIIWLSMAGAAAADGKLEKARQQASAHSDASSHGPKNASRSSDTKHPDRERHEHRDHSDCGRSFLESAVCELTGVCTSCEKVVAKELLGDESHVDETFGDDALATNPPVRYASYPYASPLAPYFIEPIPEAERLAVEPDALAPREVLVPTPQPEEPAAKGDEQHEDDQLPGQAFAGQLMLDGGSMAGISRAGLDARLLTPSRFELGLRTSLLFERDPADHSLFATVELGGRIVSPGSLCLRVFVAPIWFGHLQDLTAGAVLGFGMDIFPGRPWAFSFAVSGGGLGEGKAFVMRARAELGYLLGRSEIVAGYELFRIGTVDLSMPVLGMRVWL